MLVQCRTDFLISRFQKLIRLFLIVHREPQFDKKLMLQWDRSLRLVRADSSYELLFRGSYFQAKVLQSKGPHGGYLRDVLTGFRPVEMGRVARENDHGAGRIGFQLTRVEFITPVRYKRCRKSRYRLDPPGACEASASRRGAL